MKILVLTNVYPPHHAGSLDHHCQTVTESLRLRGHTVYILTSQHGLKNEYRDGEIERSLHLNGGASGHPQITAYAELKALELHNNSTLREAMDRIQPDVVHVFSLAGLSKSLVFTLYQSRRPVVYDVFDYWLSAEMREDPWLAFWNAPSPSFLVQSKRKALEVSGERLRLDAAAPTRLSRGYDRIPGIFGEGKDLAAVTPNSVAGFRFDRIYFCSHTLKNMSERRGFCVAHAEVIYPGVTASCVGELKPAAQPMRKFLVLARLTRESGALTALRALKVARAARLDVTLSVYGQGDSTYMAEMRSFAVSNQLPVEFMHLSNQSSDLPAIYKKHDVLLHTPEWAEPFPFSALEAMAGGLPVIGARSGGMEELLRHGENALTYPAGDAEALATRIQELMISPALRCQMAEAAQEEVLGKFNDTMVMDQIEGYLNASLSQAI